jgi:hypothetical protein
LDLHSTSAVADQLGIDRRMMDILCRAAGIERIPSPHNGKAKCLTTAGVKKLRRFLKLDGMAKASA